ncbi:hypothetical protein EXD81_16035 [Bacillus amyloliquefaciens]|nr:hypothetical protein EXD81_16035 [Bacillus amyloliquefaciens]
MCEAGFLSVILKAHSFKREGGDCPAFHLESLIKIRKGMVVHVFEKRSAHDAGFSYVFLFHIKQHGNRSVCG